MPLVTIRERDATKTKTKTVKWRRPRNQSQSPISETEEDPNPNPNPNNSQIIQSSTRCNKSTTISSLLLSTFSNDHQTTTSHSKKTNFSASAIKPTTFRGFGCTTATSDQVSVPAAVIRASADWQGKKEKKKKKSRKKNNKGGFHVVQGSSSTCVDFQHVWCGPGIGLFSAADATSAASVDCVVSKKNVSTATDMDKITHTTHRERSSSSGRRTISPETFPYLDTDPDIFEACTFGTATYPRHIRDLYSDDFSDQILMLQGSILMGGRLNSQDNFRDWRLDVDNMSYEQLLELSERIGYVNTGLKEDEMGSYIRKTKLRFSDDASKNQVDKKCSICQEEYEADDELGRLNCDHLYHFECIQQWVAHKNFCPVCKKQVAARH